MTTKIKTTLLTAFFFFGLLTGLQAQEKYQYAFISAYNYAGSFEISIDGNERKTVEIDKVGYKTVGVYNLMIREIKKMEADGWELYNTSVVPTKDQIYYNFFFFLRKKVAN